MMSGGSGSKVQMMEHQADSVTTVTNPVSGTKYEWRTGGTGAGASLGTQKNVRIISIAVKVTWTVQPTPLQCHITIDGNDVESHKDNPVSATFYSLSNTWPDLSSLGLDAVVSQYNGIILEGRSIKIEFETTGGTVSEITARVKWAKVK